MKLKKFIESSMNEFTSISLTDDLGYEYCYTNADDVISMWGNSCNFIWELNNQKLVIFLKEIE